MDLVELTRFLVKSIVKDEESISVQGFENEEDITIEIIVSPEEIGAVIGKKGHTINAIRTIVRASAYANNLKPVIVSVVSY